MNENEGRFRTVAFGGFHRQDVLDHIERLLTEHREERAALTAELEQERAARAQAEDRLAEEGAAAHAAERDRAELAQALEDLKARLAETAAARDAAEEERTALRARVAELEPAAASWARIKDTAGDIEVAAHERAQCTLSAARDQAAQVRAESAGWVLDIQRRCDRLQQDLHTSVAAAETELDAARGSFARAQEELGTIQDALSALVDGLHQTDGD